MRAQERPPPDEIEPVEEKAPEAKVTLGMGASDAMLPWVQRKKAAISRLPPEFRRLADKSEDWAENLMRDLDRFTALQNVSGRESHSGSMPYQLMSIPNVMFKYRDETKELLDKHRKLYNIYAEPEPIREPSPEPNQEAAEPTEFEDVLIGQNPDAQQQPINIHYPANELIDVFGGIIEELPYVPDPHQSILPQTATLRRRPASPVSDFEGDFGPPTMAPDPSYEVYPGTPPETEVFAGFESEPNPYGYEFGGSEMEPLRIPGTPPQRSQWGSTPSGSIAPMEPPDEIPEESLGGASARSGRTGTRELMNVRGGAQAMLDVLEGQDPTESYLRAFIPGYKKGRAERVQRSERSDASSFQRARSRMLNVPRGLQKSGGIRGMQVLRKQNFHIEQLSPGELILHARIINDGVVAQVRALVGKISRTILVEGQKVPRKKIVNHILRILDQKNHVRITVLDS